MMLDRYEIEGNMFSIVDHELGLDLKGELEFLDKETYPSGAVLYETHRKADLLHGPSYFYHQNGNLLSEAWFFQGTAVGKVKRYYPNGELYSIERLLEGLPHLVQEYYYLDGVLKTVIPYVQGLLDGWVYLYWPSGILKRQSHYDRGKCLCDQFFDKSGEEIIATCRSLS